MSKYRVTCCATKVGSAHANNAETVQVEVEAPDAREARAAAIDKVYATRSDLEHVNPYRVEGFKSA